MLLDAMAIARQLSGMSNHLLTKPHLANLPAKLIDHLRMAF
jgi:hypothetical protein